MTDLQFKAYVRALLSRLEMAKRQGDWGLVAELIAELQKALED